VTPRDEETAMETTTEPREGQEMPVRGKRTAAHGERHRHLGIDIILERKHEARETVRRHKARLSLDHLRATCIGKRRGQQQHGCRERRNKVAPKPPRASARLRPTSSGNRPRHSR
jgi:hypothetical protein